MSIVVALKDSGTVHMCCDSQATNSRAHFMSRPKWIVDENRVWVLAVVGDSHILDLIKHEFPFVATEVTLESVTTFSIALKKYLEPKDIKPKSFTILIAGGGNIFKISHYTVIDELEYDAIGSGDKYALGALYASKSPPELRVQDAVMAAIKYDTSCGGQTFKLRL